MKKTSMIIRIIVVIIAVPTLLFSQGKGEVIPAGYKIKLESKILNEIRPIFISFPAGYDQSIKRYPVLYVFDGSENRVIGSGGMVRYFAGNKMPQMIVVYIPNTDRGRDISISSNSVEQVPNSGGKGGINFMNFLKSELIPYIDTNYRTTNYRILMGYSATAGFVFHTLISEPECFDAYIAASPSVFFPEEFIIKTKHFFSTHKSLNKFLYVSYYEKDHTTITSVYPYIDKIIKENLPKGFRYALKKTKGKGHVVGTSLFDGLSELFKGWKDIKDPEIIPSNGLLAEGNPVKIEIKGYDSSIRYTMDGSEPTGESMLYTEPLIISKPVVLKARSFRYNIAESDVVTSEFKYGMVNAAAVIESTLKPGLNYKYFTNRWYLLPDKIDLKPIKQGVVSQFSLSPKTKKDGYIFQYDGLIKISKEGEYRFSIISDSDSKLFIGDSLLIFNNASLAIGNPNYNWEEYSTSVYLKAGFYPVKFLFANAWFHVEYFNLFYEGPGIKKQVIPASVLFHTVK